MCCVWVGNGFGYYRCRVRMSVIMSGRRRAIARIIPIFMSRIIRLIWGVSGWPIYSISRLVKSSDGMCFKLFRNAAQKTSLSFISCYASKVTDYVYLQRGFRNYGKPQVPYSLISDGTNLSLLKSTLWPRLHHPHLASLRLHMPKLSTSRSPFSG